MSDENCPRCAATIVRGTLGEIEVAFCEGCRGALVSNAVLAVLLRFVGERLKVDVDTPLKPVADPGGTLSCPRCGDTMQQGGYMGSSAVIIDQCLGCELVWLDPPELSAAAILFARTERRVDARRERMQAEQASGTDLMLLARGNADRLFALLRRYDRHRE